VSIVDISHHLPPYDLIQAAFLLQNCLDDFEQQAVHIVAVDTSLVLYKNILIAKYKSNWIITSDNGFLSMLNKKFDQVYVVNEQEFDINDISPERNVFTKLAGYILSNQAIETFANQAVVIKEVDNLKPVVDQLQIRATIVHVDGYDNAVTNLNKAEFEQWIADSSFRIYYKRKEYLEQIENNYAKVLPGMGVAVFNDKGWLEIAINKGKGKSLLGLKLGDQIIIEKQI
jgi:S-adenosylmethionine hydrolase